MVLQVQRCWVGRPGCDNAAAMRGQGTLRGSGGAVALDRLLIGALFNKKEPEVEGDELSFEHTLARLLKKLQQWSRIVCSSPQVRAAPPHAVPPAETSS